MRSFLLLAGVASLAQSSPAHAGPSYATVDQLWAGYDPRTVPLTAKVLHSKEEDGLVLRTVEYTSEVAAGFSVRIVAYYGFPSGKTHLPAILHLHGGGQNATLPYVKYWAKRGYAALSIDWGGKPLEGNPANGQTDWGDLPYHQNSDDTGNVYVLNPDAKSNSWYHWMIAGRRAITFLEHQPEVDPSRIGLYGVSMGGRLTWLISGIDHRIRCATSVVGAALMDEPIEGVPDSEYVPVTRKNPLWRATLDAYAYAPHITCPFFFLSASDDFYARMDQADRTIREIPGSQHWQSYTPHYSHHIDAVEGAALESWMKHWLQGGPAWPQSPALALHLATADHVPAATVQPDDPESVASVNVLYSTGIFPQARFWRTVPATVDGKIWTASLPMTEIDRGLRVYANVTYRSGLRISTELSHAGKADLAAAHVIITDPPSRVIDDFHAGGTDWFVTEAAPNVLITNTDFLRPVLADPKRPSLTLNPVMKAYWRMFTRKVGDPKWRGPAGAGVGFETKADRSDTITVVAIENYECWPRPSRVFAASAPLAGGKWETVQLPLSAFHDVFSGRALENWKDINLLGIVGHYRFSGGHMHLGNHSVGADWQGNPPLVANVHWVQSPR